MGRGALIAAAFVVVLAPASAQAAVRHASPAGAPNPECSPVNPCDLPTAVSGALADDEIVVGGGTYALGSTLNPTVPMSIHGTPGQPRPRIVAPPGSGALDSSATVAIGDLTLESSDAANGTVFLSGDASSADRVEIVATASSGAAIALRPGNGFVLRNSLLRAAGGANTDALFYQATATSVVTVRNVTAVAAGANSKALSVFATDAGPGARIDATNVIADAAVDISALATPGSNSMINLFNSNFSSGEGSVSGVGNQVFPPQFVNPAAGDFRQASGSPTIDSGLTDPLSGPLDLDGNGRTLNGRTDIGAYEHQPASVSPSPRDTTAASTLVGALRLSRTGTVRVTLTCPAGETRCNWAYTLRSARSLVIATKGRKLKRRVLQLGGGRASAPGGRQVTVRIKLSKRNFRLIKRRKRLRVKLTVRTTDAAANAAIAKKTSTLRAPKRKR